MRSEADDSPSLESILQDRVFGSDLGQPPEVIETHISRLFLTPHRVYKQKKPVAFDFLDFSTAQRRREACEAEVSVNRRLAPDVYQGVVRIGRFSDGKWHRIDDASKEIPSAEDWLVEMTRLPEERCLASLIVNHAYTDRDARQVIEMLVAFYRRLTPVRDESLIEALVQHIRDNRRSLSAPDHHLAASEKKVADSSCREPALRVHRTTGFGHSFSAHCLPPQTVERVNSTQLQFAWIHRGLLESRIANGHVVEGHGDLRAEHVYLTDPPVAIDAIEFSRQLRTVDIADELAFFAVSCEILGAAEFGQQVVDGCRTAIGDSPPQSLLDFYASYRACVRAKVAAIRAEQTTGNAERSAQSEAERYLEIADRHARCVSPPRAILVRGVSGTGKSTLAQSIAETIAAPRLSTDLIRQQFSFHPSDRYAEANRSQVYAALLKEVDRLLKDGVSVVIDGTFLTASLQSEFARHAVDHAAEFTVVTCTCPAETAMRRITERAKQSDTASEANVDVYRQQLPHVEAMPEGLHGIVLETTRPMPELLMQVAATISHHPDAVAVRER